MDAPNLEATDEFCFVYSTYPNQDEAKAAARLAVEEKLAACVNIYPPMKSLYLWDGKREETNEVAAFFKTRRANAEALTRALWSVHSYELPCFVVLPVAGGTPDYLAWVRAQTERAVTV